MFLNIVFWMNSAHSSSAWSKISWRFWFAIVHLSWFYMFTQQKLWRKKVEITCNHVNGFSTCGPTGIRVSNWLLLEWPTFFAHCDQVWSLQHNAQLTQPGLRFFGLTNLMFEKETRLYIWQCNKGAKWTVYWVTILKGLSLSCSLTTQKSSGCIVYIFECALKTSITGHLSTTSRVSLCFTRLTITYWHRSTAPLLPFWVLFGPLAGCSRGLR